MGANLTDASGRPIASGRRFNMNVLEGPNLDAAIAILPLDNAGSVDVTVVGGMFTVDQVALKLLTSSMEARGVSCEGVGFDDIGTAFDLAESFLAEGRRRRVAKQEEAQRAVANANRQAD